MIIHRLAVTTWMLAAVFGSLHAGGDATGGSAADVAEPAHPRLDALKNRCAAAGRPRRVGRTPAGTLAVIPRVRVRRRPLDERLTDASPRMSVGPMLVRWGTSVGRSWGGCQRPRAWGKTR